MRRYRSALLLCSLFAVACVSEQIAYGQNRNQSQNGFGTTGSTSGFGTSGLSGMGGSGFGSSASGGLGAAGGLGGASGLGAQSGFGGQTGGQNQLGQDASGILGRNTNLNQFLGRNMQIQGANGLQNQTGNTRGGGRGASNRGQNQLNTSGNGNNNQAPLVRPRLKIAFDHPKPEANAVQEKFVARLDKLSKRSPSLTQVSISIDEDGDVTLRGDVSTASDAKLAENLIRIEPGVRSVKNELTFKTEETSKDE